MSVSFAATTYAAGHITVTNTYKQVVQESFKEVMEYKTEVADLQMEIDKYKDKVKNLEAESQDLSVLVSNLANKPVELKSTAIKFSSDVKVSKFIISAYSPYDDVNGINSQGDPSKTATGATAGPGKFAVDPSVIPYGSKITIIYPDGTLEHGVAEDTGGAIKNNRIDVFRWQFEQAMKFGMKEAIVIWER